MAKYRKKQVVIEVEAKRWFKHGDHPCVEQCVFSHEGGRMCSKCGQEIDIHGVLQTPGGRQTVCPGDWITVETGGWKHAYKPDAFEANYEKIEENPA